MLFETQRLRLRRLRVGDVDALLAVYGDAEAMRWVGDGQPLTRPDCVRWVDVTEANYRLRGYGMSAIELRASGCVIGFCGLVHPDAQPEPEIKYALLRTHCGMGYASEAASAMLRYGAERFRLNTIIATVAAENAASQRVLLTAGMCRVADRIDADGSLTVVFNWHAPEQEPAGK